MRECSDVHNHERRSLVGTARPKLDVVDDYGRHARLHMPSCSRDNSDCEANCVGLCEILATVDCGNCDESKLDDFNIHGMNLEEQERKLEAHQQCTLTHQALHLLWFS